MGVPPPQRWFSEATVYAQSRSGFGCCGLSLRWRRAGCFDELSTNGSGTKDERVWDSARTDAGMTLDVTAIRKDFPILERKVYGKPLVYLDNAATSQKPRQVIDALVNYYENYNANIHRAVHRLGEEATAAYEEVREKVARFINAPSPECIVFTRNTSESINLVAYTWGRANLHEGDEILTTEMEHHSNFVPSQRLAKETGARLRVIGLTDDQALDVRKGVGSYVNERTKIVAMVHATIFVRSLTYEPTPFLTSSAWSSVRPMTRRRAPVSLASLCHGTKFEWCSISVVRISSPSCKFARPQV